LVLRASSNLLQNVFQIGKILFLLRLKEVVMIKGRGRLPLGRREKIKQWLQAKTDMNGQ
jgi:hypothetical protein